MSPPMSRVADAPACRPGELLLVLHALEGDVERLGEVLPQEVAGAGLERLAVLHHRLDAERVDRAGELLPLGLGPDQHGHRHELLGESLVDADHLVRFVLGFLLRRVRGVPLLPEELGRSEEQARPHLPAHDVAPLVDE